MEQDSTPAVEPFAVLMERALSRRQALMLGGAGLVAVAWPTWARGEEAAAAASVFKPLAGPGRGNFIEVPQGYQHQVLVSWGDPLFAGAPAFDPAKQSGAAQARQLGTNSDFVGFLPLPLGSGNSAHGLLCVSSEMLSPEMTLPGWRGPVEVTAEQVATMKAALGLNIVEIQRAADGQWKLVLDSQYNRRVTVETPIELRGPAAGSPLMRTKADSTGCTVLGTLYNCSGGITPWGTWLQAEEGFPGFFGGNPAGLDQLSFDRLVLYNAGSTSPLGWERHDPRFDFSKEPNEIHRFGWIVETDPYDPSARPIKRTALGRTFHESATVRVAPSGRISVYSGDDHYFEHIYKFVSTGAWSPEDRSANLHLLDVGTLHVARFSDGGKGEWIPLVWGQGGLTPEKGFASQAEVLIFTRAAARAVGATPMDRPEDIEVHPQTGAVYISLTANILRNPDQTDAANPRGPNHYGHIIELREEGNDAAATTFEWEIFLLCGPKVFGGGFQQQEGAQTFSSPDNLATDNLGNLWIATDGQPGSLQVNDGLFMVPTAGRERGKVRQFLSAVPGAEVTGPCFTPDNRTLFCAIQHPGVPSQALIPRLPSNSFPDYKEDMPPRAGVIAVTRKDGGVVGS